VRVKAGNRCLRWPAFEENVTRSIDNRCVFNRL
jgi:hypothetical protein